MGEALTGKAVLLFDAGCVLCSRSANYVASHDRAGRFWYADLSSTRGRALLHEHDFAAERLDSVVLIAGGAVHTGSAAAIRTAAMLGPPWSLLALLRFVPTAVREPAYRLVARNRHRLFRSSACPPPDPRLRERLLE